MTFWRMVVAPINDATLQEMPRFSRNCRYSHRPHRFAFAHDLGGHALTNFALRAAILDQRFGRPRKHVDEPRRDREPARINNCFRAGVLEITETGNAIALDRKIDTLCLAASAVVNRAAFNDDIEILRASGNCDCRC